MIPCTVCTYVCSGSRDMDYIDDIITLFTPLVKLDDVKRSLSAVNNVSFSSFFLPF